MLLALTDPHPRVAFLPCPPKRPLGFARLIGIDPATLSRWERNLRVPAGRYALLAEAFVERFAR
jgi:hypothetical protein